jgi:hypothetical protein
MGVGVGVVFVIAVAVVINRSEVNVKEGWSKLSLDASGGLPNFCS